MDNDYEHDNMVRAWVPECVTMKTRLQDAPSIDSCNIVNEDGLESARECLWEIHKKDKKITESQGMVTNAVIVPILRHGISLILIGISDIKKVPRTGIEPVTRGFSVPCSTDWATSAQCLF